MFVIQCSLFDTLDSVNISCSYISVIEEWGRKSFCEAEIPELLHIIKKQEQQKYNSKNGNCHLEDVY